MKRKKPVPAPVPPAEVFDGTKTFEVYDADIAFPTVLSWFTPYERIPEKYKDDNTWTRLWRAVWFKHKKAGDARLYPREGVNDKNVHSLAAARMVAVVSGCWGIQHEHKEALLAYIYDSFFEMGWFVGEEPPEIRALMNEANQDENSP